LETEVLSFVSDRKEKNAMIASGSTPSAIIAVINLTEKLKWFRGEEGVAVDFIKYTSGN